MTTWQLKFLVLINLFPLGKGPMSKNNELQDEDITKEKIGERLLILNSGLVDELDLAERSYAKL